MKNTLNILLFLLAGTLVYDNCDALGRRKGNVRPATQRQVVRESRDDQQSPNGIESIKTKEIKKDEIVSGENKNSGEVISGEDKSSGEVGTILSAESLGNMGLTDDQLNKIKEYINSTGEQYAYGTADEWNSEIGDQKFSGKGAITIGREDVESLLNHQDNQLMKNTNYSGNELVRYRHKTKEGKIVWRTKSEADPLIEKGELFRQDDNQEKVDEMKTSKQAGEASIEDTVEKKHKKIVLQHLSRDNDVKGVLKDLELVFNECDLAELGISIGIKVNSWIKDHSKSKYTITPEIAGWSKFWGDCEYTAPELRKNVLNNDTWRNNYLNAYRYVLKKIIKNILNSENTKANECIDKLSVN